MLQQIDDHSHPTPLPMKQACAFACPGFLDKYPSQGSLFLKSDFLLLSIIQCCSVFSRLLLVRTQTLYT